MVCGLWAAGPEIVTDVRSHEKILGHRASNYDMMGTDAGCPGIIVLFIEGVPAHMDYESAVSFIESMPKFVPESDPGDVSVLLEALGRPEEKMRVIHVAGTNGKGSVCAFLEAMLRGGGRRCGLFTSPHLTDIRERFQIDREMVCRERFFSCFQKLVRVLEKLRREGMPPLPQSAFLFALGMLIFEEEKVEDLVMETGLGGRLDPTNAVRRPALCVITSISLDHMQYLGDTVEKIAAEKAGIIKEGISVVFDGNCEESRKVIENTAEEKGAEAFGVTDEMIRMTSRREDGIDFVLNNKYYDSICVRVPFAAEYQMMNCALALCALRILDPLRKISDEAAAASCENVRWAGRMERVLPDVIVDGAHNEDGIREFLKSARYFARSRPLTLLFAAVSDKDYTQMIRQICEEGCFERFVVTRAGGNRSVDPEEFGKLFASFTDRKVYVLPDAKEAFALARDITGPGELLLCAGSLYLAGIIEKEVMKLK